MLNVGETIRELRKRRNLNQDQLAEMANLNRVTIAKYESGKIEPGAQALSRIADALEVSVDELLGREDAVSADDWPWPDQDDETIRLFARGVSNMTQENREKLLAFCRIMFHEDFDEEGHKKK